uniref:Uncharacterized protein n=1 Tax=Acrobeloides nanus TaxID=290746 RepID=A0A914DT77_9BILA
MVSPTEIEIEVNCHDKNDRPIRQIQPQDPKYPQAKLRTNQNYNFKIWLNVGLAILAFLIIMGFLIFAFFYLNNSHDDYYSRYGGSYGYNGNNNGYNPYRYG